MASLTPPSASLAKYWIDIYPKNKYKNNPKSEKVDDYISQNINIYNNINKYYYKNNFDLLTDNENIISKKPKEDNLNINYNKKQFSDFGLFLYLFFG